ncbi:hypothetical protein IscW_ISCW001431 [Ixodes scapularis]|uniref:Secreted protein n=1 Tax=Ixodes scapularis TaxID=6945 RepID=B7P245_IXOSC|nr:hypothetical protein IscW_ISCW001431 [Ixodes scapularis]|eukprot:XP_002401467.1 hypothetical protein IscW_ISCW001431 [Ixodes scapularis]
MKLVAVLVLGSLMAVARARPHGRRRSKRNVVWENIPAEPVLVHDPKHPARFYEDWFLDQAVYNDNHAMSDDNNAVSNGDDYYY